MKWHIYHAETGVFTGSTFYTSISDPDIAQAACESNTPLGHKMHLAESVDHLSQKIDTSTGQLVDYQPAQPSDDHEWNDTTKRWVIKQSIIDTRNKRNTIMAEINALEAKQPRIIRDIFLNSADDTAAMKQLHDIEDQIVEYRKILKELA